jgi:hypothetical protein
MDQSARYADLSLKEEDLIKGDKHILVAYHMQPAAGYGYLEPPRTSPPSPPPAPTLKFPPPTTSPRVLTRWFTSSTKPRA